MSQCLRLYCIFVILFSLTYLVDANNDVGDIPAQLFLEMDYHNPQDHASGGWCDIWPHDRGCDVYFIICIWNANKFYSTTCDIARKRTAVFADNKKFQLKGPDLIQLPISKRVPEAIKIRVEIWDQDKMSSDDHIVTFASDAINLSSKSGLKKINLLKIDKTYHNDQVSLGLRMKLDCSSDYYGMQCENYCKTDYVTFHCGQNGSRICYPGHRGEFCEKRDDCFHKPCASNAQCANMEDGSGRMCYCNGGNGPECYEVADICNPSPCQNGGVCKKAGPHLQQFICECRQYHFGATCSERFSSCEAALNEIALLSFISNKSDALVCLNGGKCVDHPTEFTHACICTSNWKGTHCEIRDWTVVIVTPMVVLLVLLLLGLLILLYWRTRRWKKPPPTIEVLHHDRVPTIYFTKQEAACENEMYSHLPNHVTDLSSMLKFDNGKKIAPLPPRRAVRDISDNENEYDHLVDQPPASLTTLPRDSFPSIRSPRLLDSTRQVEIVDWSDQDVYEAPNLNLSDSSPQHGIRESLRTFKNDYEPVNEPNFDYDYICPNIEGNENERCKDDSTEDYLPQLPVKLSSELRNQRI